MMFMKETSTLVLNYPCTRILVLELSKGWIQSIRIEFTFLKIEAFLEKPKDTSFRFVI